MKSFATAVFFAASASFVNAHGMVSGFWANGQENTGAVRAINSVNPVVDVNASEMACGWGSAPAGSVAEVSAGSEVEWQLKNGDGGTWVHAKGPVTYAIYKCPGSAKDCQPSGAGWAMIGHNGNDGSGDWQMAKFTRGENVKVKIPSGIPTGDYLIRQELIALHNGHEQYIQCAQIHVTGSREGGLDGAQLVGFPGAYSGSEPGFSYNVYGTSSADYPYPGPALYSPEGSGSPAPAPKPEPAPAPAPSPAPAPAPAPVPPPSGGGSSGGSCTGGEIKCNGESAWSMCANGAWINMGAVAPGTKCSGGSFIKRASSRLFKDVA